MNLMKFKREKSLICVCFSKHFYLVGRGMSCYIFMQMLVGLLAIPTICLIFRLRSMIAYLVSTSCSIVRNYNLVHVLFEFFNKKIVVFFFLYRVYCTFVWISILISLSKNIIFIFLFYFTYF